MNSTHKRNQPSHPPISHPHPVSDWATMNDIQKQQQTHYRPVSPPKTPPRHRRPSVAVTNPITWLSRNQSSTKDASTSRASASKPVRISEPKFANALDLMMAPRTGALGQGATVVRTPHDALGGMYQEEDSEQVPDLDIQGVDSNESQESEDVSMPRKQHESRALPPLPLNINHPYRSASADDLPRRQSASTRAQRPTRPPPPPPPPVHPLPTAPSLGSSELRPSLKRISPSSMVCFPPVPAVPAHLMVTSPQPAFEPILVGTVPTAAIDPSKIIVTVESSTVSHRTALNTLMSRPSHLATWLSKTIKGSHAEETSLREEEEDRMSTFSHQSDATDFHSIFHNHLHSAGLLSPISSSLHVFLDRPSAP
jgi:hypothetical protein